MEPYAGTYRLPKYFRVAFFVHLVKCMEPSKVRSLPVENLLPQNVGSIINYLQLCTEAAQWGTPNCNQPHPDTNNGVRDSRSN